MNNIKVFLGKKIDNDMDSVGLYAPNFVFVDEDLRDHLGGVLTRDFTPLDYLSLLLFSPSRVASLMDNPRALGLGLIALIMGRLSVFTATLLALGKSLSPPIFLFLWLFADLIPHLVCWILFSSLFYMAIESSGAKSRASTLKNITALAMVPGVFAVPISLVLVSFSMNWLYLPVRIALLLWSAFIIVNVVSKIHKKKKGMVLLGMLLPLFVTFLILALTGFAPIFFALMVG